MRGPKALMLLFGAGVFVGAALGLIVASSWSVSRLESLRGELRLARDAAARARSASELPPQRPPPVVGRSRVRAADVASPGVAGSDAPAAVGARPSAATGELPDGAARAARVADLVAARPRWFEHGAGDEALAALRELSALVPEGREAAMALALAINADVSGEGRLQLSDVAFYSGLGDPAVKELMDWALVRDETPPGFRVIAAYSLPWTQDASRTLSQFAGALRSERASEVQRALVANLGRLRDPAAERLLGGILADTGRAAALRAAAAAELATTADEGLVRVLETAARSDEDAAVRDAARAALIARDPPATGYLVTGTLPDSQAAAAGLRVGDVLVSYDGRAIPTADALQTAASAVDGRAAVPVVVVRDGSEVTVLVRGGRLGVFGRGVVASER